MPKTSLNHYIDSTVLLDFYLLNSLPYVLKLPIRIVTIDIMAADLETPSLDEIRSFGVFIFLWVVVSLQKKATAKSLSGKGTKNKGVQHQLNLI